MDLSRFARRRYTPHATPIEPVPRFSAELAASCPGGRGPEVWIKRDDQLGLFPGGNKTRKLELLVADALAQGADTLVTCGAPQSNHCRITLAAAVKEGLKCRFVIEERVPGSFDEQASGNHFMFRLLGVEAITVVPGGSDVGAAMQQVADALRAEGRRGYVIPGGGSNALGGLGYVACAQEMQQQWFEQGLHFDTLVVGSGSSGTHGGLLAGFLGNRIDMPIIGVGVSRDPADQEPLVWKEAQAVVDLIGAGFAVPRQAVQTVGGYWQPMYSVPNPGMVEAVQMLARTEGILLDPVYTGKVMAGLIDLRRWGYTPQKPIKRAYEQRPEAVKQWLEQEYPAVERRAKAEGGEIHWGDQTALVNTDMRGRSYAPRGKTPVTMAVGGTREKLSMISTVTNQGRANWMIIDGAFNHERLIEFLQALVRDGKRRRKKVFLILDNLRVHHCKPVKDWLAEHRRDIEVFFLPSYSPELNPDERLNADLKQAIGSQVPMRTKAKLRAAADEHMQFIAANRERVQSCFQDSIVKYAA